MFLNDSIAPEDLVDPALNAGSVWDVNLPDIGPALREFLAREQAGPREIAKRIFNAVCRTTCDVLHCCARRACASLGCADSSGSANGFWPLPEFELRAFPPKTADESAHLCA